MKSGLALSGPRGFDQILADVGSARAWFDQQGIDTAGSRLEEIEGVLTELVRDRASLSCTDYVAKWDWASGSRAYFALTEGNSFGKIAKQLSALKSHLLPRDSLRRSIGGPLIAAEETPANTEARNFFLELDVAASLLERGFEVSGFDDVRFTFAGRPFIIQCKRPFSQASIVQNLKNALVQLQKRLPPDCLKSGIIAIAADKVIALDRDRPIPMQTRELEAYVRHIATTFHEGFLEPSGVLGDRVVFGVLLVTRFLYHDVENNFLSTASVDSLFANARRGTRAHKVAVRFQAKLRSTAREIPAASPL